MPTKGIKKLVNNLSMKSKILFTLIIVALLTLVIASITSYYASRVYNEKEAINYSKHIVNLISSNLNTVFNSMENTLATFTINDEVVRFFENAGKDSEFDRIERTRVLEKTLLNTIYPKNLIKNVLCFPINGYSLTVGEINSTRLKNFREFDIYKKTLHSSENRVWLGIHDFEGNNQGYDIHNVISVSMKVKKIGENNILGTLEIQISEESLYSLFKSLNNTNNSGIIICDKEGNIVTGDQSSKTKPKEYFNSIKPLLLEKTSGTIVNQLTDGKYLINFVTLKNGWKVVHFQPYNNLITASLGVGRIIIIVGMILIVVILFIALVLSNVIMRPLTQFINFTGNSKYLTKNQLGQLRSNNEITNLYSNYNVMLRRIKESELDTLRAQITPHFLYNTLNSIKCKAVINDDMLVANMTEALIDLLELTISNPNEYITVRDELKIIDSYILLQQSRQSVDFSVIYETPEEFMDYLIPKMLLQPIIENSILHGFSNASLTYLIQISIERDNNDLIFYVKDNGIGMSADRVIEVLGQNDEKQKVKFNRIGLNNVNDRIKLYVGDKYGLEIQSENGSGTTILIRIPSIINPNELIKEE